MKALARRREREFIVIGPKCGAMHTCVPKVLLVYSQRVSRIVYSNPDRHTGITRSKAQSSTTTEAVQKLPFYTLVVMLIV